MIEQILQRKCWQCFYLEAGSRYREIPHLVLRDMFNATILMVAIREC